jgi:DNA polymerase III sliding clamp (beta) subunit (PCNA family)
MEINIRALKAVALAASIEETRYYLKGVNIEVKDNNLTMVATNGHLLMGMQFPTDAAPCNIIIPLDLIRRIKLVRKIDEAELEIEGTQVTIRYAGGVYGAAVVDGSFPDWRRICPKEVNNEVAQFDVRYFETFYDAAKLMYPGENPRIVVGHNGGDPALIGWYPDALGVLMPVRNITPPTVPEWIKE